MPTRCRRGIFRRPVNVGSGIQNFRRASRRLLATATNCSIACRLMPTCYAAGSWSAASGRRLRVADVSFEDGRTCSATPALHPGPAVRCQPSRGRRAGMRFARSWYSFLRINSFGISVVTRSSEFREENKASAQRTACCDRNSVSYRPREKRFVVPVCSRSHSGGHLWVGHQQQLMSEIEAFLRQE